MIATISNEVAMGRTMNIREGFIFNLRALSRRNRFHYLHHQHWHF